ncbi:MAG: SDR family oxidoreductase [Halioglobus sp.]|nr:SDR family oxidoreductase [Halioglobus sp.]
MTTTLEGRVYIVTGGSRGFGLAIAKDLVAHGGRVGLISRNQAGLDKALNEIGTDHAFGVAGDVGHMESITAAFAAIKEHFGRLDGLINNAGLAWPNPVEKLIEKEVVAQVNTNFLGTVFCCQAAIPLLRGGENPRILNISSASAWHYDEIAHLSIYAATKAAVERFTRDLRLELQADNIGVTCIRPGGAITDFAGQWSEEGFRSSLAAWKDFGTYMDMGMDVAHVGESVRYALSQPPGVAVDLLEIRPNVRTPKSIYD